MSGPVRRQSAPAATPREYPTASACHPWAWLPPFRFVASAPPIGSPSLDLPQTLPRLRGRTPPPQPHVQPVHASHANRASASWFSRIVISTRLAHPQAFENPLRTPSDSIRPDYALDALVRLSCGASLICSFLVTRLGLMLRDAHQTFALRVL
jgi:hypothetical protein